MPAEISLVPLAGIGNSTVHDHDIGVSHVLSPDQRILRHVPTGRLAAPRLALHGSIGKFGPCAGLPSTKVGKVHAVSQSHFAPSFDKIMQITAR